MDQSDSNKTKPYGRFAYEVTTSYIYLIIFFTLLTWPDMPLRVVIVAFTGTLSYLINTIFISNHFGLRGWSNFKNGLEPKLVMMILCWPVFAIWLLTWPLCKAYSIYKSRRQNIYLKD